jgi:hypothetical protein
MKLIETKTLGTAAASIEFTSIPQTFTDLVLLCYLRSDGTNKTVAVYFNNDTTAANYSIRRLDGNGSSVTSEAYANAFLAYSAGSNDTSNTFSNVSLYIANYAGSTSKSLSGDAVWENNATNAGLIITAGLYSPTTAITSVKVDPQVDTNLVAGSTISLYGITKGSDGIVTTS